MKKCPECSTKVKAKGKETYLSCPECLTRFNAHTGNEVAKQPTSFHHYDPLNGATFVEYVASGTVITDPLATLQCLLCGSRKSELHMTRAALLGSGTLLKQQTLLSLQKEAKAKGEELLIFSDNLGEVVTRKIKIPRYISGHVCDSVDCTNEFNRMCATRSPEWHLPEAKLVYTPIQERRDTDVTLMGGASREVEDISSEEQLDAHVEYESKGKTYSLGIRYHRADEIAEKSIQERSAERKRVKRLDESTQSVNPKPSKRVRDMRKMIKG